LKRKDITVTKSDCEYIDKIFICFHPSRPT
jgi:hypothetical protein